MKLLKSTDQYNQVAVIPYASSSKKLGSARQKDITSAIGEAKSSNLVYLEGSNALSSLDCYTPKFSENFKKKVPQHYKEWYQKAREGLLEDEKDLWSNIESVQIVRKFMTGSYSKREDLAMEKLIYELGKESKKIFKL